MAPVIVEVFDADVTLEMCVSDGGAIDAGATLAVLDGPISGLLGMGTAECLLIRGTTCLVLPALAGVCCRAGCVHQYIWIELS